jgi:hypothetical protein
MTGGPIALRPTANFSGRSSCANDRVAISGNAHGTENDQRGKHAGDIGHGLRLGDDDAHALLRAEEFRDDGSEEGVDDRHVEAGEDIRRRVRQLDDAVGLEPARGQRPHQVDLLGLDRAQAGKAVDHHREEGEQRRDGDLRTVAEAEPDHDQRRDGDLRQALQRERIGHRQLFEEAEFRHQRAEQHAHAAAERKAERRVLERAPERQVIAERTCRADRDPGPQGPCHRIGRGKNVGRHLEELDGDVPERAEHDQADERDQRQTARRALAPHVGGRRARCCGGHRGLHGDHFQSTSPCAFSK